MEPFWDLLFQLMKHGTNTLHVVFIFLFSIDTYRIVLKGKDALPVFCQLVELPTYTKGMMSMVRRA